MSSSRRAQFVNFVYFIKPIGMDGPVKVGMTIDVGQRLDSLQCASPFPLELIFAFEGSPKLERRFHAYFNDSHSHGEWFRWSDRIAETIEAINAGTFNTASLPETGKRTGGIRKLEAA